MHADLTKLSDCWWAVRPSRLTYCRWQKSGSCPETPRWGQNQGQGSVVCVRACVCAFGWITSACTCKCLHAHIHPRHQLHLSLTWESLMTEAEKPKKRPSRRVSRFLPPFIFPPFHLSPSWPHSPTSMLHMELSGQAFFFFLNPSWPGTQSIRHPDIHLLAHQLYSFNEGNLAQALEHTEKIHTPLHYCIYNKGLKTK